MSRATGKLLRAFLPSEAQELCSLLFCCELGGYLLSIPGEISIPLLQLDPTWVPLREQSRLKSL